MNGDAVAINPWMMLPFGVLLGMIALAPLCFGGWWRRHYPKVAFGLAAITLAYYFLGLHAATSVWHMAHDYFSFMVMGGALYVVAGGIHLNLRIEATPLKNVLFLLTGAMLANVLGTTGASMLLIRPWLRLNRNRIRPYHIVFFIFLVSNVGGSLTPIGDPPLFLGHLMGIPFWWVAEHCLLMWLVGVGLLLALFFFMDCRASSRLPAMPAPASGEITSTFQVSGLFNLVFLAMILGAVFVDSPPFLREGLIIAATLGSWFTTPKSVHQSNEFNFHPIQEVAILFAGIFATMMPALDWLGANANRFDASTSFYYWSCGSLSSFLDNAPTYLCFLKAISAPISPGDIRVASLLGHGAYNGYIIAISVASVFFGACTYVGNGPNFMVKSIADQQKVPCPSFPGYILKFTIPCLLPVLLIIWWLFFRH